MGGRGGGSPATRQAEPVAVAATQPAPVQLSSQDENVLTTLSNMLTARRSGVSLESLRLGTTVPDRRGPDDFTPQDLDESLDRLQRAGRVVTTDQGLYRIKGRR